MSIRFAVFCGILTAAIGAGDARAAIWAWGCSGALNGKQVMFTRNELVIVPPAAARGKLDDIIHRNTLLKDGEDGESYMALDGNSGFEPKIEFEKNAEGHQKLTLTEKFSRVVKVKRGRAGPRDEETTTFQKVYSFAFEGEPKRDIRMQCMEYTLSTTGGRG